MSRSISMFVRAGVPVLVGAIVLAPVDARADGPINVEVGGRIGGGTDPNVGIINPLGLGLGARGGVIWRKIYAGGTLTYYFGDHGTDGATRTVTNALQAGFEAGYGLTFSSFTIRPQLGIGNISFKDTVQTATPQNGAQQFIDTTGYFYLEPGVVALFTYAVFYTGADANVLVLPNTGAKGVSGTGAGGGNGSAASFTAHWQFGVRF